MGQTGSAPGVPGDAEFTHDFRLGSLFLSGKPANGHNPGVDPIVIAVILVVGMPLAVLWALARSSRLRGPLPRPESRRPVESLVTEVVPEEHPDEEAEPDDGPAFSIDSEPPEPDPDLREREP